MELNFDIRGNLKPYARIEISYEEFKEFFVSAFEKDSKRYQMFEHYERYTQEFREKITGDFRQWINGSFVSNKKNPKDIDIVNLVDYSVFEEKESLIRSEFIRGAVPKAYGIDAYLVILYPENHKLHRWTQSDLLHWNEWFTRSRMDWQRRRYPKGFIEINFGE